MSAAAETARAAPLICAAAREVESFEILAPARFPLLKHPFERGRH
jgi:hypothetical protein